MLFIAVVNALLYFSYDKIFFKMGISKKLFMNSTLLGTTTGFTFPFLAIYYNFKNVAILYMIVIVTALFMLNSRNSIMVSEGMSWMALKPSLHQERGELPAPMEVLVGVQYSPDVLLFEDVEEDLEASQNRDEDMEFMGEYVDSVYLQEMNEEAEKIAPVMEEERNLTAVKTDVDPYKQALIYRQEGNLIKALEGFMVALKSAATFEQEFSSCMNIAAIYKEIGQSKQAENVLYCFVEQHRDILNKQSIEEIADMLKS